MAGRSPSWMAAAHTSTTWSPAGGWPTSSSRTSLRRRTGGVPGLGPWLSPRTAGNSPPGTGRAAVDRAVRDPAALKVLAAKFRPPPDEPDPRVAALVADLDSDSYAT